MIGLKDVMRRRSGFLLLVFSVAIGPEILRAQTRPTAGISAKVMDRDLMEVTVPQLEAMYWSHKYTVTQVVEWYLARVAKYNGIYRALEYVDTKQALETAAREDADAKAGGANFNRGPLW